MMARQRRGRGEGSIYPRKKRGKQVGYVGAVTLGYTETGKQRRRWVYGKTKTEVLEKLDKLRADRRVGLSIDPPKEKLGGFLTRWLEDEGRASGRLRHSTYLRYRQLIRIYIVPAIGGVALGRVTPVHLQGLLAEMERQGKSTRLRQMAYGVLHRAFNVAVQWGLLPRNVCDAVTKPRRERHTMQVLTKEQVDQFLHVARQDRLHTLYLVAVTTGMRQGELFGLSWDDVDLTERRLHVRRQLARVMDSRPELIQPKTEKARRQIALPEIAVHALKEHRKRMFAEGHLTGEGNPLNLVFTDTEGKPLRPSNVVRRSFRPLLKKAEVPRVRFHDLRHTAATLLLKQGVHPKIVQERMGHSQISMTLDTYSHVTPDMQRDAADKLDELFVAQRV